MKHFFVILFIIGICYTSNAQNQHYYVNDTTELVDWNHGTYSLINTNTNTFYSSDGYSLFNYDDLYYKIVKAHPKIRTQNSGTYSNDSNSKHIRNKCKSAGSHIINSVLLSCGGLTVGIIGGVLCFVCVPVGVIVGICAVGCEIVSIVELYNAGNDLQEV